MAASRGLKLELATPIESHDGQIRELVFAPLTAGLMMRHKRLPFQTTTDEDGAVAVDVDYALAGRYISELTGVDEILLGQMAPEDFVNAITVLARLLGAHPGNS